MRIDLKVPTSFAELRSEEMKFFCKALLQDPDPVELKLLCLMKFTGLRIVKAKKNSDPEADCQYRYRGKIFPISADMMTDILTRLDYLTQPPGLFNPPANIRSFFACNSRLFDLKLEEWLLADAMYNDFSKTKDEASLNKMIAVFYRRPTDQWDEAAHIDVWAKRFRNVPMPVKYAVYLWYTGVKSWLINKYYYVFNGGGSGAEEVGADEIIMGILSNLNDGHAFENKRLKATEMHEALYELNRKIEYIKTKMK